MARPCEHPNLKDASTSSQNQQLQMYRWVAFLNLAICARAGQNQRLVDYTPENGAQVLVLGPNGPARPRTVTGLR